MKDEDVDNATTELEHTEHEAHTADRPEHDARRADLTQLVGMLRGPLGLAAAACAGLFGIALLAALYIAQGFFIPVILALLLDRLLSPVVRAGQRIGLPTAATAALVLLAMGGVIATGTIYLSGPATEWIETAPDKLRVAEYKLRGLKESVEQVQKAAEEVEKAVDVGNGGANEEPVQVREATVSQTFMSQTQGFVVGVMVATFLLFFLLSSGDMFLRKLVCMLPQFRHRRNTVRIVRSAERDLSGFLSTMALINLGLGTAVGLAMFALGMPNPVLWGLVAASLNFVPYIGPIVGITIVGLVAIVSFEQLDQAVLPPLAYFVLNAIEGQFVTPIVLGWRFTLNPVAVFVALTFWSWLWGIPGALLAVPLLMTLKIICENIEILEPVSVMLGR